MRVIPLHLFEVVTESDLDAVLLPQHLAGHQGVEDSGAGQRQTEVHAEQPPVLGRLIELHTGQNTEMKTHQLPLPNLLLPD